MRATELAKEISRQGHKVTLYAVLGEYDYSNFENEYGIKVKNLGPTRFATFNSDGHRNNEVFIQKVFRKVFHKILEYPDVELAFKVSGALKRENNVDLLITVAIPYPLHWGAAYRKEKVLPQNFPKTWVADCGDPYMGNKFHKHPFYFKYIEKWFCKKADYLSIPIEKAKSAYYKEFHHKIRIIPQGFDFSISNTLRTTPNNNVQTFIYAGVFYKDLRDPRPFLDYLCSKQTRAFKFVVYTKSAHLLKGYKEALGDKLDIRDYIPREELLGVMAQADFLVNFENKGSVQSPSKLIDYALAKRPVLSIEANQFVDKELIDRFLKKDYSRALQIKNIEQYNIANVAKDFLNLISNNNG